MVFIHIHFKPVVDAALKQFAEQLASDQAADEQRMAELDKMDETVRLGLQAVHGISLSGAQSVQTMAVLRAAHKMKMEAVREFLKTLDAELKASDS